MSKENTKQTYTDFVNEIAQNIKTIIQNGGADWKDVFNRQGCAKFPVNSKGNLYSGVNMVKLLMAQLCNNYNSNQWLTFKQIKALKGSVNKGEKSSRVFFFTVYEKEKVAQSDITNRNTEIKKGDTYQSTILCPKYYPVFNLSQTSLAETENAIIFDDGLQNLIDNNDVEIVTHDRGQACYIPSLDIIKMPSSKYFDSDDNYKATLLHELAHSTMHEKRLNRNIDYKCNLSYAREELVAELSSAMLCAHFGINSDIQNHASYIDAWLKNLKDEDFTNAVKECVKVVNYFLVDQKKYEDRQEVEKAA